MIVNVHEINVKKKKLKNVHWPPDASEEKNWPKSAEKKKKKYAPGVPMWTSLLAN